MDEARRSRVRLLLDVLPIIAEEEDVALEGGAAINLFVRNLPRLIPSSAAWRLTDSLCFRSFASSLRPVAFAGSLLCARQQARSRFLRTDGSHRSLPSARDIVAGTLGPSGAAQALRRIILQCQLADLGMKFLQINGKGLLLSADRRRPLSLLREAGSPGNRSTGSFSIPPHSIA